MDAKTQQQYAETFHGLHWTGDPLVLFNAWDVASAKAIAKAAVAIATSSGAVASALGYADGENVPFDTVAGLVSRLTASVSVPVSIDLEAGYGDTPDAAATSATAVLKAGAIGINIEDGLSGGKQQLVSRRWKKAEKDTSRSSHSSCRIFTIHFEVGEASTWAKKRLLVDFRLAKRGSERSRAENPVFWCGNPTSWLPSLPRSMRKLIARKANGSSRPDSGC